MRKRWLEANQPMREQWLEMLADEKKATKVSSTLSEAEVSSSSLTNAEMECKAAIKTHDSVSMCDLLPDAYMHNRNEERFVAWSNCCASYECWQHARYMIQPNTLSEKTWDCKWQ